MQKYKLKWQKEHAQQEQAYMQTWHKEHAQQRKAYQQTYQQQFEPKDPEKRREQRAASSAKRSVPVPCLQGCDASVSKKHLARHVKRCRGPTSN